MAGEYMLLCINFFESPYFGGTRKKSAFLYVGKTYSLRYQMGYVVPAFGGKRHVCIFCKLEFWPSLRWQSKFGLKYAIFVLFHN